MDHQGFDAGELFEVLENLPEEYPTTGQELADQAARAGAPQPIMDFFESIGSQTVADRVDVIKKAHKASRRAQEQLSLDLNHDQDIEHY